MNKSEQINEIAAALSKFQGEVMNPTKDKKGHNYMYADLASVLAYVRPTLAKHGLSIFQFPITQDTLIGVETTLSHESGQWISNQLMIPLEAGKMSLAQGAGSVITYLRRYSLTSVLGIAQDDNDADMQISKSEYVADAMKAKQDLQAPPTSEQLERLMALTPPDAVQKATDWFNKQTKYSVVETMINRKIEEAKNAA